ncbi:MAG: hypothetical protein A3F67_09380 [Verrucomicrobia bacterium RIFCSPHIGHO2_12_FULL_41_10]|nr:MAG: hypothetical protein A3F67_09380 [Verrucomicrobia bacterium RIFCSPHIGHO2_12_FULL_41_10]
MTCPFSRKNQVSLWEKFKKFLFFSRKKIDLLKPKNLHAILDATVDALVIIDEKHKIIAFNKSAEKLFGYKQEEIIGLNVNTLMPEPFRSKHDSYIDNYLRTGVKKIIGIGREVIAQKKDLSTFPIDLAVSEVITNSGSLFTGIIRDISQKKKMEAVLAEKIKMEAELKAKNEYISILSHELRTPLTSIYGALGLLSVKGCSSPKKTEELISIAVSTTERLIHIVDDLLDIGRIQSKKLAVEKKVVSLVELTKVAIKSMYPLAKEYNVFIIEKNFPKELQVLSDRNRLIQVVTNFLSNAIKFSPPNETVTVSIEQIDNDAILSVSDRGEGISEEFQKNVFLPFSQDPKSHPRIVGGTGLGLHICKSIIEQFNGTIGFTSVKNNGSTFYFKIPIVAQH